MRVPFYSTPLRASFATFLAQHGRRAACNRPAPADLRACACGKDGHDVLDLLLSGASQEEFDQQLSKELDFHRKMTRTAAGNPDHNQLTVGEIAQLLDLQDGLCFCCANALPRGQDGPQFDRDHFLPILQNYPAGSGRLGQRKPFDLLAVDRSLILVRPAATNTVRSFSFRHVQVAFDHLVAHGSINSRGIRA